MEHGENIGFCVRNLSLAIKRAVDARRDKRFTNTHGWVIAYLYENRGKDVYQRDIEKRFSVRRPTMTQILKLMEKNGLIKRVRVDCDARLKKIELTPLGLEFHEWHERDIEAFEKYIRSGISDAELKCFFEVTAKLYENALRAEKEAQEEIC